jgi:hypothetical protein
MAKSDQLIELILSKTNAGKLKWEHREGGDCKGRYFACTRIGRFSLVYDILLGTELIVSTGKDERSFFGPEVEHLFYEVYRLVVSDDPDVLSDLENL